MKTVMQHLQRLPEPYRTQALENIDNREDATIRYELNIHESICSAFIFCETPQGNAYWNIILRNLNGSKLSCRGVRADLAAFEKRKKKFVAKHSEMIEEIMKDYERFAGADYDFIKIDQFLHDYTQEG